MFEVITVGGATRDVFFEFGKLKSVKNKKSLSGELLEIPYGAKMVSENTFYTYGGGAVNASVCFSRLGARTAAIANIGQEGTGTMVVNDLKKEGVNVGLVKRDSSNHTGLSVFLVGRDGEHTGFLERGANDNLVLDRKRDLKRAKWIYLSSLTGKSAEIIPEVFSLAKKGKVRVAFNPGSQQLNEGYKYLKEFLQVTEVLLLNIDEAEKLVASKLGRRPKNEKELLSELSKMGPTISVITMSEKGSIALFEGNLFHQKAFPAEVKDTTGAGDAFGATFVFGIMRGFDIRYALKTAAINSASVVSKMGARDGLLTYNKIKSSKWL